MAHYTGWWKSYHCRWRYTHSLTLPNKSWICVGALHWKTAKPVGKFSTKMFFWRLYDIAVIRSLDASKTWYCISANLIVKKLGSNFLGFVLPNITLHFWVSFSTLTLSTLSNSPKLSTTANLPVFASSMAPVIRWTPGFPSPPWKWRIDASAILRRPHCLSPPGSGWTVSMGHQVCRGRTAILMRHESYE